MYYLLPEWGFKKPSKLLGVQLKVLLVQLTKELMNSKKIETRPYLHSELLVIHLADSSHWNYCHCIFLMQTCAVNKLTKNKAVSPCGSSSAMQGHSRILNHDVICPHIKSVLLVTKIWFLKIYIYISVCVYVCVCVCRHTHRHLLDLSRFFFFRNSSTCINL